MKSARMAPFFAPRALAQCALWTLFSSVFFSAFSSTFFSASARAAPPCLATENPCDPDKLCTFKAALAEKVLIYQIYLRNSQVTRAQGSRDGVRYGGALYDAAMAEAAAAAPNESVAERKERAGQIFQDKVKEKARQSFTMPTCRLDGQPNLTLMPKPGYAGMFTNEQCQVRVDYNAGEYDPEGFGASDPTSCPEFYDRDRAHEAIHKKRCEKARDGGVANPHSIDRVIEEEIAAYEHSVKLTKAYVRLLAYQCSAQATPAGMRTRSNEIKALLAPYVQGGG